MVENGIFDSIKEGGIAGTCFGFAVGSARLYIFNHLRTPESPLNQTTPVALPSSTTTSASALRSQSLTPSAIENAAAIARSTAVSQLIRTTTSYAALGALFLGTETMCRNTRDEDDVWNRIVAAAVSGAFIGVRSGGRFFVSMGAATAMVTTMGLADVFGNTLGSMDKTRMQKRTQAVYRE